MMSGAFQRCGELGQWNWEQWGVDRSWMKQALPLGTEDRRLSRN